MSANSTRDDFKARMSDLAGALDAVEVTDEQLGLQPGDPRVDGPFNRVKKLLGVELDGITTLQKIIGLRVALQHPDKAKKLHENFDFLGIAYPPKDWGEAWKRVSVRAVRGLGEIREEVRSGTPAK
jgi:hypothetical protein